MGETERGAESAIKEHQEQLQKTNLEAKHPQEKEGPMVPRIRKITGTRSGLGWVIALIIILLFGGARGESYRKQVSFPEYFLVFLDRCLGSSFGFFHQVCPEWAADPQVVGSCRCLPCLLMLFRVDIGVAFEVVK